MKNFKKLPFKFLVLSIIVGLFLTISIGFSIWLITDRIEIKPSLDVNNVITEYLDNLYATYEKDKIFLPSDKALGLTEEDLKYNYKLILI